MENEPTPVPVDPLAPIIESTPTPPVTSARPWLRVVVVVVLVLTFGLIGWTMARRTPATSINTLTTTTQSMDTIANSADATNYFGINLLRQLTPGKQTTNTVISPLSLSLALTWTTNGAVGATRDELERVLGLTPLDLERVNQANSTLIQSLIAGSATSDASATPATVRLANSLWLDQRYSILPSFNRLSTDIYHAQAQTLDFEDPQSLTTINNWVSQQTNGKIPTVLSRLESQLYLVNAVYFNASWQKPFEPESTQVEAFHQSDGSSIDVPVMHQTSTVAYGESNGIQMVALPYKGTNQRMIVFLPSQGNSVDAVAQSLTWDSYATTVKGLDSRLVQLTLPKFRTEFGQDLVDQLKALGAPLATSTQADFSQLVDPTVERARIGQVIHKTFVDTDEYGTEAAATTAVGLRLSMSAVDSEPPKTVVMTVDRPFIFAIEDSTTHAMLFLGVVNNPDQQAN